jgi:glycosyltransferase involved in cell wall biosynthesis
MKLALLKGNRFNPWHMEAFTRLDGAPEVVAFRAQSEIQQHFSARDDSDTSIQFEPIHFDTQAGNPITRLGNELSSRYLDRTPHILPFWERLEGFDVLQTWELFTDWTEQAIEAKERFGTPLSVMVWDNIPFNNEPDETMRARKQRTIEAADAFVVHTERSGRTLMLEGVDEDRIVAVPPGVDTERFHPGDGDRSDFGIPDDAFVILFVGWLLPRKGIDWLLLALRELLNEGGQPVHLVAVGSGPGQERVDALVERLDLASACTFTGSLPHGRMPDLFRCADTFVLPSIATPEWQEQFGVSLLEAMASGTPVVSTYSGAIPEIVGDAGVLCQPNDFVALHGALRSLMDELGRRTALGLAGRKRAAAYFDVKQQASALSELYARLTAS